MAESSEAFDLQDPIGTPALPARLAELLKLSVGGLRARFVDSELEIPRGVLPALREDPRAGVRALATILDDLGCVRQHASDDPALLGHPQALFGAELFDPRHA